MFFQWTCSRDLVLLFSVLCLLIITFNGFAATTTDICRGASLLDITDRGSVTNTPCVLPSKSMFLETGYQYKGFTSFGSLQTFPQPTLFIGLPDKNELSIVIPTYNQQSFGSFSGASASMVGIKHEMTYGKDWVAGAEIFLTPAGGSASFGSNDFGVLVNGMAAFNLSSKVSITFMLGGSTATEAIATGGGRFNSFNPSFAMSYAQSERLRFFIEAFAQTKTGAVLGGNYNADCGLLYLFTENIVFDLELGQQLSHQNYSFNQFIGGGVSLML